DHDTIAEAHLDAFEPHHDLRECAVGADDHRVGDVLRYFEERLARMQKQVVGERTARVRPLGEGAALNRETLPARLADAAHAAAALAARSEILISDAITFLNPLAVPVGRDAI